MARKPAQLEMAGGKGLRQRVWERIRLLGKGVAFDILDISHGGECTTTVREYVLSLEAGKFITAVKRPKQIKLGDRVTWILVNDVGVDAPRIDRNGQPIKMGMAQQQMWQTLRRNPGDINARELSSYASTSEVEVHERAANLYLRALRIAGYLEATTEGGPGRLARYRLVTNTGPKAPMIQRTKAIYDPNLDEITWVKPINEETAIYGS